MEPVIEQLFGYEQAAKRIANIRLTNDAVVKNPYHFIGSNPKEYLPHGVTVNEFLDLENGLVCNIAAEPLRILRIIMKKKQNAEDISVQLNKSVSN